jgi:hypothetical protein
MEERVESHGAEDEATGGPECRNHVHCDEGLFCREGKCVEVLDEPHRSLLEAERRAIERAMEAEARARAEHEAAKRGTRTSDP